MNILDTIATLLPLSMSSGLNLYATILVVGLSIRFGWVQNTPAGLEPLSSWVVISIAGFFFLLETLADKIPFIDNTWDLVHTIIRPLGGAMLGVMALGTMDPLVAVSAALIFGSITLVAHGGKASTRILVNVLSPLEGASNIFISSLEDVVASFLAFLALKAPYLAFALALVLIILVFIFAPRILRWGLFTLSTIFYRIISWFKQKHESDELPPAHRALIDHQVPQSCLACFIHNLPGFGGRKGYVSILPGQIILTSSFFMNGTQSKKILLDECKAVYLQKKLLVDIIEIFTSTNRLAKSPIRLIFLKDRSRLASELLKKMNAGSRSSLQTRDPDYSFLN